MPSPSRPRLRLSPWGLETYTYTLEADVWHVNGMRTWIRREHVEVLLRGGEVTLAASKKTLRLGEIELHYRSRVRSEWFNRRVLQALANSLLPPVECL